ncbi:CWF19-like protein 2 [Oppia nitens]|uniref:CWF19-like protein 2 n=1 Tax=Oppia nitens TaxID=1686743 RepID=UPI0023DBAD87|nr:CWF19-like protein 2 [Oppia nitens]
MDNDWLQLVSERTTQKKTSVSANDRQQLKREQERKDLAVRTDRELNPFIRNCLQTGEDIDTAINSRNNNSRTSSSTASSATQSSQSSRNSLNAKLIKAQLMGNQKLIDDINEQMKQLDRSSDGHHNNRRDYSSSSSTGDTYTVKKRVNEADLTTKEMYLKAKSLSTSDESRVFIATTSRLKHRTADDEYEDDVQRKQHKKHRSSGQPNDQQLSYIKHQDDSKCRQCVHNIDRQLIVHNGEHTLLMVTPYEPFVSGYCHILSKGHTNVSFVSADEECIVEINERKRQLCDYFVEQHKKKSVIFVETYLRRQHQRHYHLLIECIAIKQKYESEARIFFKKAIMECDTEWSMNKKLIEINNKCPTRMIPKGLSYFCVTIGPKNNGFAHVIEDEESFSLNFGKEVIGGLLDVEPHKWLKPKRENFEQQLKRGQKLKNYWKQLNENRK